MIEIQLDRGTCRGYGNCVLVAPGLFSIDAGGRAELASALVGDEHLDAVRKAVYDCPSEAIGLVQRSDPGPNGS